MIKVCGQLKKMTDQLIFEFPKNKVFLKEDFYVSSSNQEAYDFIESWPKWIKRISNIFGPFGSGKTHLASILKKKTSTLIVDSDLLNEDVFLKFKTKETLIIENLNESVSENILFSLWNAALQDNKYFLVTSLKPINTIKFDLPDLNSRASNCIIIGIKLPSDDLVSVILGKNVPEKQIQDKKTHIDYITKRLARCHEKSSNFIAILDQYSLKKGTPFSLKLVKEVLKMI